MSACLNNYSIIVGFIFQADLAREHLFIPFLCAPKEWQTGNPCH